MNRTRKEPAAELLTLAGGYLVALEAILCLSDVHAQPPRDTQILSEGERLEAITELASATLGHREAHLSAAALSAIQALAHAGNWPGEKTGDGRGKPAVHKAGDAYAREEIHRSQ